MYCTRCGAQLQAGERFCGACGLAVGTLAKPSPETRLSRHLRLLAMLWLALSALRVFAGVVVLLVGHLLLPTILRGPLFERFLPGVLTLVGVFYLAKAGVGLLAGWGLIERQPWARLLTLILGFLALLDPPFGTALGVYTLWVLLPAEAEEEYRHTARAA